MAYDEPWEVEQLKQFCGSTVSLEEVYFQSDGYTVRKHRTERPKIYDKIRKLYISNLLCYLSL